MYITYDDRCSSQHVAPVLILVCPLLVITSILVLVVEVLKTPKETTPTLKAGIVCALTSRSPDDDETDDYADQAEGSQDEPRERRLLRRAAVCARVDVRDVYVVLVVVC